MSNKYPILFVDINLGNSKIERITIFEGDDPAEIGKTYLISKIAGLVNKLKILTV